MKKLSLIMGFSLCVLLVRAQDYDAEKVVRRLADIMKKNYVYPDKGAAMHDLVLKKLDKGNYADFKSPSELAEALDADLKSVVYDKHIRVRFDPERVEAIRNRDPHGGREPSTNFGFEEVKILEGNIGYLDLRGFADVRTAEDVAVPAMDKLIESDAIIFDLRKNGGGSPSMIRFICSYLFAETTHLNTFYWRPDDRYSETWTNPAFASQIKPDIPVYVLTSDYTFSAAEEFTYDLKSLKRATIIGEVTGGGAHPGGPMLITDGFLVNVPQGRAINPVTQTNWEGVGVAPDINVPAEEALTKALELARKAISNNK
ncbi:S41 family peptidase [Roseivirga pacifica]|uniref:S41 family peptidase n=1 Tax=Roseivirga pacifica TaxID=1267423 RepID=UPI00227B4281|nr:S41 family peptidase [Roseivirga pacifica]